ncbi:MAG: hypothetical protein HC912_05495 [Saprospiraceae bacterium]|nr:hypothetical protein [Saprospiraceae bacterium]
MKQVFIAAFFVLFASTLLVGQISKVQRIQQWVDSLNNIGPYTFFNIDWSKMDYSAINKLSYTEIDSFYSTVAQTMKEQEEASRISHEEQIAAVEFNEKVVVPRLKKCKTDEERDALILQYPEFFGDQTLKARGITKEMVKQRRQERIKLQKSQQY